MSFSRLYINGYNFDAGKLYGDKLFPVSAKTPMISHLIRWNHDTNWHIPIFNSRTKESAYGHHFTISLEGEYACMEGNKINSKYKMLIGPEEIQLNKIIRINISYCI